MKSFVAFGPFAASASYGRMVGLVITAALVAAAAGAQQRPPTQPELRPDAFGDGGVEEGGGEGGGVEVAGTAIKPFTLDDGMKELDEMSQGLLRGDVSKDVNSAGVVSRIKDIAKSYLYSLKDIQGHLQDGNGEKAAAAIKATVGNDSRAMAEANEEVKSLSDHDSLISLEEVSDAEFAEYIQPQVFDGLVDHTENLLTILEGIDLDFLSSSPPKRKTRRTQKKPNQGEGFKFDGEFNPFGFGFDGWQSSFHQSNPEFHHPREFLKHPFVQKMFHKNKHSFVQEMFRKNKHPFVQKMFRKNKSRSKSGRSFSRVSSFFQKDDIIMAKHRARQEALGEDTCPTSCENTDWVCHCSNLFSCVGNMTEYDLVVLIAGGFIDKEPESETFGNFTLSAKSLNFFDADEGVKDKLTRIQEGATVVDPTEEQCKAVLKEIFTACDPDKTECSDPNTESYQVSTELVCDAVNTPTKLLFEAIGEEFDGFVDVDYDTTCEPLSYPLSYDVCREFVAQFDRLYDLRDKTTYTEGNPMAKNDATLHNRDTDSIFSDTQFPIEYWFPVDDSTGVTNRTDFSAKDGVDGYFMIVNPNTGMALGLEGDSGCGTANFYPPLDTAYGPRVIIQDPDSTDTRQHWLLTSDGKIQSEACSAYYLTAETGVEDCVAGSRLILREPFAPASTESPQTWKIGVDDTIAIDYECSEYYTPNLVISRIEDDEAESMRDNKAYVSFVNPASFSHTPMALSVEGVCDQTMDFTLAAESSTKSHMDIDMSIIERAMAAAREQAAQQDSDSKSTQTQPNRRRRLDDSTPAPTSSPSKSPTSTPTSSPTSSPSETPRVDLREYDETDQNQQFLLYKTGDYVLIYHPYCSEHILKPKFLMVNRDDDLVELKELDFTDFWALVDIFVNYEWRWAIEGDGLIELVQSDEDITKVLSMADGTTFPPSEYTDLHVYDSEGENWSQTWTVTSPSAILLSEEGSDDQAWKAEFVDPYINYALLPGFPGTVSNGCLSSAADPELAKGAMHRCDQSMSLLVGSELSLGTLKGIADDIQTNSVDRMPGSCCFDTPTTNDNYFGVDYDPTEMTCQNTGPWHLGISEEACENAGGHWFRTPCVTLKEAIDERTPKFDFDNPSVGQSCQDTLGQLTTAYVSTNDATYVTNNEWDCLEFCRVLTGYNDMIAMMTTDDSCLCYYQDGAVPSTDSLPDDASHSPPKFYVSDSTNGLTLGIPRDYDCDATEINIEAQSHVSSVRQQFQLTLDHQIVSAACSGKVLTANCATNMLYFSDPVFPTDATQQWNFAADGSITNEECGSKLPLSTAEEHSSVIESFFGTIVNPTTSMAIGMADLALIDSLSVTVGANWTDNYPVDNNTYPVGQFFTFETSDWKRQFGSFADGDIFYAHQWRDGSLIWSGEVAVYEYYEYPETGFCTPSKYGCDTGRTGGKGKGKNNDYCTNNRTLCESKCKGFHWCDTTPPPTPARGHRVVNAAAGNFEEGDQLTPTANCEGTEYHPHLEMQTAVAGNPNQQFYIEDDTTIVSLICPDLVVAVPDDDCSNGTPIRIKTKGSAGSEWHFNDDTSIESGLCPGEIFDINIDDMSAYAGDSLILSSSATYFKWTMTPLQYTIMSAPFSIINPSTGKAIGVEDVQCTNEMALEFQDDDQSQNQQFFLGKSGLIHSQKCHGLVLAMGTYDSPDCSEGQAVTLQPATGDERTQWTFDTDGSIASQKCTNENLVIDVEGSNIVLNSNDSGGSQMWRKVSARLLTADVVEWVQTWNIEFVEDYNGTLPSSVTTGTGQTCYEPNDGFSASFEDWAEELVIDNASDESQCEDAREQLGYERDHPFDTEVVDTFSEYMCDGVEFTAVDSMSEGLAEPPTFTEVEFEAPEYPDDPDLTFDELPEHEPFETPDRLGEKTVMLTQLQDSDLALENIRDVTASANEKFKELYDDICQIAPETLCVPVVLGNGGCFTTPARFACIASATTVKTVLDVLSYVTDVAYRAVHWAYEKGTLGPGEENDSWLYVEATFKELTKFDKWNFDALETINGNIFTQHTEMREHLQDRHQAMVTDIVEFLEISTNTLGNQFNLQNEWLDEILCQIYLQAGATSCDGDGESLLGLVVEWPEERVTLWDKLHKIDETMNEIQKSVSTTASLNAMNGEGVVSTDRLFLESGTETNQFESIHEKMDAVEDNMRKLGSEMKGKVDAMEGKLAAVESSVDAMEGKLAAVESSVDAMEGKLAAVESSVDAMEGKLAAVESSVDAMEAKLAAVESSVDDMKIMMSKLLSVLEKQG